MSGTAETAVVDTEQIVAMPSPEIANINANGSGETSSGTEVIRQSGGDFQTSATA